MILSKETNIPYTTIDSFFKRSTNDIKISVLGPIANYFELPIDFFYDNTINESNFSYFYERYKIRFHEKIDYFMPPDCDSKTVEAKVLAQTFINELNLNQVLVILDLLKLITGRDIKND